MVDALSNALSGLMTQSKNLSTIASNVANANTGSTLQGSSSSAADSVDLSQQAVNLIETKTAFKADVAVIKTQEKMMGDLLDTIT